MCSYISNTLRTWSGTQWILCVIIIIIIQRTSYVDYQGPCKVCLKFPILSDFICTVLESPYSHLGSLSTCERWPLLPTVTFLDSTSGHTAFHSGCHLSFWARFPWDSRNLCDVIFYSSSILWILHICLKTSPVITFLIPSKAAPKNSLAWF